MNAQRQGKIHATSAWLAAFFGLAGPTVASGLLCLGCPDAAKGLPPYDPPILEPHVVRLAADAAGDSESPAHVALFLQRGALRLAGGALHLVEGTATGALGDPPPRIDVSADRVSVVQAAVGGVSPKGDASFDLALGRVPIALLIETGAGEPQSIDLGGVSIASARVHTTTGHVVLDWTRANAVAGGKLELATEAGALEVIHLDRFGGGAIEVKEGGGLVSLDFGDRVEHEVTIDAEVGTGKLLLRLPKSAAARADVRSSTSDVTVSGWRREANGFVLGADSAAPRVVIHVRCTGGHVELGAT